MARSIDVKIFVFVTHLVVCHQCTVGKFLPLPSKCSKTLYGIKCFFLSFQNIPVLNRVQISCDFCIVNANSIFEALVSCCFATVQCHQSHLATDCAVYLKLIISSHHYGAPAAIPANTNFTEARYCVT